MLKKCANPNCTNPLTKVLRKGYCNTCALRLYRNGSLEYKNPSSNIGRWKRPEYKRNMDQPLYYSWKWMRLRYPGKVDRRWDEYKTYAEDVCPKPSERSMIRRKDNSLPWGPVNFYWREPALPTVHKFNTSEGRKAYQKDYKKAHPGMYKYKRYKAKYGITEEQYNAMYEAQGGVCYICKREKPLQVDHNHETGEVRKLLCNNCNSPLGHVNDSVEWLEKLIAYVKEHDHGQNILPDQEAGVELGKGTEKVSSQAAESG